MQPSPPLRCEMAVRAAALAQARTAELLKKEEEKQQNMLKMLGLSGLKAGQKITIAPRKEG